MTMVRLGDVLEPRREVVHPRHNPIGEALFVGLEHIESNTGRRIGALEVRLEQLTGRKPRFHPGDIVYGYLRPYLNKVWVADRPGLCSVDQYVFATRDTADPQFIATFLRSPLFLSRAPIGETPGQLPRIRLDEILAVSLDLPDIGEQRRISARISQQLVAAQRLRAVTESRRSVAALAVAALVTQATSRAYDQRPFASLKEVVRVVRSTSTVSDGDAEVLTVTSGCLTPSGFLADGLRPNRMRREDVDRASLAPGEVLVSRSNTEDLVGRTAEYSGDPPGVVATDLVFRVVVDESKANRSYVAAILAGLQLQGYWTQRSSGASSTMKKITKVQLGDVVIPLPPLRQQRQIAEFLGRQLEVAGQALRSLSAEAEAARELSKAILISEFAGSSI